MPTEAALPECVADLDKNRDALQSVTLECVRLDDQVHSDSLAAKFMAAVADALARCSSLQEFSLQLNTMPFSSWAALLNGAFRCRTLQYLDIRESTKIDAAVLECIAAQLSTSPALKALCIVDSLISDDGTEMAALRKGLFDNDTLEELVLSGSGITSTGARNVVRGLRCSATLRVLDLSFNGIDDEGLLGMSQDLCTILGLSELRLRGNKGITDVGGYVLCDVARDTKKLRIIDVTETDVSGSVIRAICAQIEETRKAA